MITQALKFVVGNPLGKLASLAALLAALVASFAFHQQSVGVKKQKQRQERTDANVVNRAADAARRAADPAARGVRDPYAAQ
jgi:hypothetical protein